MDSVEFQRTAKEVWENEQDAYALLLVLISFMTIGFLMLAP